VLKTQKVRSLRFGEAALQLGLINVNDLRRALAQQYELPHLLPESERISSELVVACEPFNRCAEQIRALRTQLLIRWSSGGARCPQLSRRQPRGGLRAAGTAHAADRRGPAQSATAPYLRHPRSRRPVGDPVGPRRPGGRRTGARIRTARGTAGRRATAQSR